MTKLFVIPGHGAGDPGAGGNGYDEAERVRALATRIKKFGGDNVILADFSRNYYADNGISYLSLSSDTCIVELHMDSGPSSAKGGHVIIQEGIGGADSYDRKLEALMKKYFPGRANTMVERDDLANPARAAARGFNYRLVENGFISNAGDVATFNSKMDEIAKGYCEAFGIKVIGDNSWPVQMYQSNGTNAQKWKLKKDEDGYFTFTSVANGMCLDVNGQGKTSGTIVQAYKPNGTDAQKWKLIRCTKTKEGYTYDPAELAPYEIEPKCAPGLRLDVWGGSSSDGTKLTVYTRNQTNAQLWYLIDNADGTFSLMGDLKGAKRFLDVVGGGK